MENPQNVYECGNPKCSNSIDAQGMNAVQLKALGRWPRTCNRCNKLTVWQNQIALFATETAAEPIRGSNYAQEDSNQAH